MSATAQAFVGPSVWRNSKQLPVKPDVEFRVMCLFQVSMAEFMTDEDLEALKTDVVAGTPNAGLDTRLQVC